MYHSLLAGKSISKISKALKRSGSTWPGHIALKSNRKFIKKIIAKNPHLKIVFVAGTNGKTTTTKALTHILNSNDVTAITNKSGANLLNGLASTLVLKSDIFGKIKDKTLIFEVDENSLPIVLEEIPNPDAVILLNLFRDQLDRYGEVNTTAEKWKQSLGKLGSKTLIVANADDPMIAFIAKSANNSVFFTIDNILKREKELSHAVDSTTCPNCSNTLKYTGISYSHLGNYKCDNCGFENPKGKKYDIKTDLQGDFNIYNLTSAALTADKIFGINPYKSIESLKTLEAAFGRQEIFGIDGKKVMLLLAKNPTGFNESLKVTLKTKPQSILLLLNDRIPDGRDISWIWDVDFENLNNLKSKIYVAGDRAYDLSNRLFFAGISNEVFENYQEAYKIALEKTQNDKTLIVLPTYSAMLEVRKMISGQAII